MSEKNKVKPRVCETCKETVPRTAHELKRHSARCRQEKQTPAHNS